MAEAIRLVAPKLETLNFLPPDKQKQEVIRAPSSAKQGADRKTKREATTEQKNRGRMLTRGLIALFAIILALWSHYSNKH